MLKRFQLLLEVASSKVPSTMRGFRIALGSSVKNSKSRRVEPKKRHLSSVSNKTEKSKTPLRSIPGVGPKNEQRLCDKGIRNVESLLTVFTEQCQKDRTKLVEYLREEVGILHRHHCLSIAGYLTTEESESKSRVTLSVEGNISAGKTTLLSMLMASSTMPDDKPDIRDLCQIVTEPVHLWQCVGGNKSNNLLERFYANPSKHAYEFQNYVFLTRMQANCRTFDGTKPLRLLERSIFSDRLVFVRAVHESKWLTDEQLELYDSWFDPLLQQIPGLIPDGFIYLKADPETCMRRLRRRARNEEVSVTTEYLEGLHLKHEDWFSMPVMNELKENKAVIMPQKPSCLDLNAQHPPNDADIPEEIKDSVIWLGQNGILSRSTSNGRRSDDTVSDLVKRVMRSTPALILDCNEDIDPNSAEEYKRQYAAKVKTYYQFVQRYSKKKPFWLGNEEETRRLKLALMEMVKDEHLPELYEFYRSKVFEAYDKGNRVLAMV